MQFPLRLGLAILILAGIGRTCSAAAPEDYRLAALTPEYATKPEGDARERPKVDESQLNRLVRELKKSGRSFGYLRTVGFDLSDRQFEELIAANDSILRPIRIVRRDEKGNRITPGWPGVALNLEHTGTNARTSRAGASGSR